MLPQNNFTDVIEIKEDKPSGNFQWPIIITVITFIISVVLSLLAANITEKLQWYFAVIVLIVMIFIGVLFDILGVAIATADEVPFHALAAKKGKGAKQGIFLLRNAEKMSNLFNDVIGDIAGIISGATTTAVVSYAVMYMSLKNDVFISAFFTALTAAVTVGGKALGKSFAIRNSNVIVLFVAKIVSFFYKG